MNLDHYIDVVDWSKSIVVCPNCNHFLRNPMATEIDKLCRCDTIGGSPMPRSVDNVEAFKKKFKTHMDNIAWVESIAIANEFVYVSKEYTKQSQKISIKSLIYSLLP